MFANLFDKIREMIRKVLGTSRNIESALHIKPTISTDMINAIELWGYMYQGKAPWLHEPTEKDPSRVTSLGLPAFIASEKARMCTLEMRSTITPKLETVQDKETITGIEINKQIPISDGARADFLNDNYQRTIIQDIREQLEYGIAKGGLVIKPFLGVDKDGNSSIYMDYIQADSFYPISFDFSGRITEAAFVQRIVQKDYTYSRLEYHKLDGKSVTVINKAFRAQNIGTGQSITMRDAELGNEVPLSSVPEWESLEPETTIQGVDRLLFAYFKPPIANTIDTYSPLGVSAYSRAVDLIKDADMQYSRFLWELEGSELAVDVDRDALTLERDAKGNDITVHSNLQKRLYRKLDLNSEQTYNVFNPSIRDSSHINSLNNILMRIEDTCELARGTLADVNAEARTATEISVLKQRSYAANAQLQSALEDTLRDVVYIMDVYTTLYNLAPLGDYDISFEWDDSIQVDKESEMNKRLALVDRGITSKVAFRMWYFGETEEQAVQELYKAQEYRNFEISHEQIGMEE